MLALNAAQAVRAGETIVVRIVLNETPKGVVFARLEDDDEILLRSVDLAALGLAETRGTERTIEGEGWVELRSMPGLDWRLERATLTLRLTAAASYFPVSTLNLLPRRLGDVIRPRETAAFFNYRLNYLAGKNFRTEAFTFGQDVGFRAGDFLFFTDGRFEHAAGRDRWIRLTTSLTRDDRVNLTRLVVGDFVATSGLLGTALGLGGVSFSRNFGIDPYLITRPLFSFTGSALSPSQVDVYLDGQRIASQAFPSGPFVIRNLDGYTGARTIEIAVRDASGREERFRVPFYFSQVALSPGFSDFSYSLGAPRRNLGEESFDYGRPAFLGFHRWGISNRLTLGGHAEANGDGFNAGPEAAVVFERLGTVTAGMSVSAAQGRSPSLSGALSWIYGGPVLGGRFFARTSGLQYFSVEEVAAENRVRTEIGAGLSVANRVLGSLNADWSQITRFSGSREENLSAGYSRQIAGAVFFRAAARWVRAEPSRREFFVGISVYPWTATTISAGIRSEDGRESVAFDATRTLPLGEGVGWGVTGRIPLSSAEGSQGSASVQYKGRYGLYAASVDVEDHPGAGHVESYLLSAAGGIGWVDGAVGFTRPILDSFGVARVGGVPGVRVYQNGQFVGRTNERGETFMPELASYLDNQITIENRDIPIEYTVSALTRYVSPPYRSGSIVPFGVARIQGVAGSISVRRDGETSPLEFALFTLEVDGASREYSTGKGGEFFVDNLPPGRHSGSAVPAGRPCRFVLEVPRTTDFIVELAPVVCEPVP